MSATGQATGLTIGNARIVAAAASGAADTALLTVIAAPPPPPAQPDVRFSEIHYDNARADVGEAIEIVGSAGTDVTGWRILLYNGTGGAVYNTKTLSGVLPSQCDGRGTLVVNHPVNGIQNGAPDGIALVDAAGTVVEFPSYEGTFTAVGGPARGPALPVSFEDQLFATLRDVNGTVIPAVFT